MDGFPVSVTEVLCLGASVTLSSICYYMYKKSRTKVDRLEVSCGSCVTMCILQICMSGHILNHGVNHHTLLSTSFLDNGPMVRCFLLVDVVIVVDSDHF